MDMKAKVRVLSEMRQDNLYNRPIICTNCKENIMQFVGGGEYKCPTCGHTAYDDWGRVREYLYSHKYATALDVSNELGIPRGTINQMLREEKIQIADGANSLLTCQMCGRVIRSGRFCSVCEKRMHQNIEEQARAKLYKKMRGTYVDKGKADDGQMYLLSDKR